MLLCGFSIAQRKRKNKNESCMFVFIYKVFREKNINIMVIFHKECT